MLFTLIIYLGILLLIIFKSLTLSIHLIESFSIRKNICLLFTSIQIESSLFLLSNKKKKIDIFLIFFIILIGFFLNIMIFLNIINNAYCMNSADFININMVNTDITMISSSDNSSTEGSDGDTSMTSNEINNFLETYNFEIERLLRIDRFFYNIHMSSPLIRVNPVFFENINLNLIVENNDIEFNILACLNFININNIGRDDMIIYKDEYSIIFENINDFITEIKKTTTLSMQHYLYIINNINPQILTLTNFLQKSNNLNDLTINLIYSFLVYKDVPDNYFQNTKDFIVFLDQTTDLIRLNMELIDMLEDDRVIDNNIGFDFNPRSHQKNIELINMNNLNQLINYYRPIINYNTDIQNIYRQPPFFINHLNREGFIVHNMEIRL